MREGTSKVRCLLAVELYELSNKYIYEMREQKKKDGQLFDILPTYTINTNENANNRPIRSEYFLQFVGNFIDETPEKYLLFRLNAVDNLLDYEISNGGIEDIFKDYDFKKLLSVFKPMDDYAMSRHAMPNTDFLVVEITYETTQDHFSGGWECESSFDIIGYLDSMKELKLFNFLHDKV